MGDDSVTPSQILQALGRIWHTGAPSASGPTFKAPRKERPTERKTSQHTELQHTTGKPSEVVELYRGLDRICQDFAPGKITRGYKAKYISWAVGKWIFCSAHLQQGGLRVWVKTDPKALDPSSTFARDVSRVGHWGLGNVELAVNSSERLREAEPFIRKSFEKAPRAI